MEPKKITFENYLINLLGKEEAKRFLKVLENRPYNDKEIIIIDGPQGACGKTTLCNALKERGIPAVEKWMTYTVSLKDPTPVPYVDKFWRYIL